MLENVTQHNAQPMDISVTTQPELPLSSLEKHSTAELAAHLNVPISETEKLLGVKPIFRYPKKGLYGLL